MSKRKQRVLLLIGIAFSALFFYLAVRNANLAEINQSFQKANWWYITPFLLTLFTYYWFKAYRWHFLLTPIKKVPTNKLFTPVIIGYASNTFLPIHLGELIRTFITWKKHDIRPSPLLTSIVLERMFDFLTVLLLLGGALVFGARVPGTLVKAGYVIAALGGFALIATILYIRWTDFFVRLLRACTSFLPESIQKGFLDQIESGAHGMQSLRQPRLLFQAIATSIIQWGFMWLCVYISLRALGIELPPSASIVVLAFMVIGLSLPTSPGYVGNIQLSYTLALSQYGIGASIALAASVFFHILAFVSVTLLGLYFAKRLGYDWKSISDKAQGLEGKS